MTKLRVAVIEGGPSAEANVSRSSAAAVAKALNLAGHEARVYELSQSLAEKLETWPLDVVFPATHGAIGEDGCLQGALEVLDYPYVGSGVLASALAASKPHAKVFFRADGLPVAADEEVSSGVDLELRAQQIRARLGPAVVVKPASGGSAIGTTLIAANAVDLDLVWALEHALEHDDRVLVERFVRGSEITCGVLEGESGPVALPPTHITSKAADWYDFRSRYSAGGSEHRCPAPLPPAVFAEVQRVAVRAFTVLGCRDLARVDFVVAEGDEPSAVTLLEVNTLPGMTATSLFPEAAAAAGIPFPELCERLVRRAQARPRRRMPRVIDMP